MGDLAGKKERLERSRSRARPVVAPAPVPPGATALQRAIGNRATVAVLQSATAVGPESIRRYFVHTPSKGRVDGRQFQAQERPGAGPSFVDSDTKDTTVTEPATRRP